MAQQTSKADIALIGLAVMGQNLILNMDSKGYTVCAYNRTIDKIAHFLNNKAKGTKVLGANSLTDMVEKLKIPRKIILLVKAGEPVDNFIQQLIPLLSSGDVIIDGGNSNYMDTTRRCEELKSKDILFVGCGISGGEMGARYGLSLMPGGHENAWPLIKDIFQTISAKVDNKPCCEWMGERGAGHFVKMVHNGIEYGDMQLICEAYHIMKLLGMHPQQISEQFAEWNREELNSYLIEITSEIVKYKGKGKGSNDNYLLERIRDTAEQKGTGKWTILAGLKYGIPTTICCEAVFGRFLSALKEERCQASELCIGPSKTLVNVDNLKDYLKHLKYALYCAKIVSYAQGFMLMREAARINKWNLKYGDIASIWRSGCIIRSGFLNNIKQAYESNKNLENLLFDRYFREALKMGHMSWREVVAKAILWGIPVPVLSTALTFYDGYRCEKLPANLIQAHRDYFGAHMYELLGHEGIFIHTNWTGSDGTISSSAYEA